MAETGISQERAHNPKRGKSQKGKIWVGKNPARGKAGKLIKARLQKARLGGRLGKTREKKNGRISARKRAGPWEKQGYPGRVFGGNQGRIEKKKRGVWCEGRRGHTKT